MASHEVPGSNTSPSSKSQQISDSKRHQTIDQIWVTIFKWMFGEITIVPSKDYKSSN